MSNGENSKENDFTWLWISLIVTFAITFLICGCCLWYSIFHNNREETENSVTKPEIYTNTSSIDESVCSRKPSCISGYNNDDVKQNIKIVPIEPYAEKWRRYQRSDNKSSFAKCGENTNNQLDVTIVPKEIYVQKWRNYNRNNACSKVIMKQYYENTNQPNMTIVPKEIYVQKWLNHHTEEQSILIDEANNINTSSKRLHEKARRHTFGNCYVDPYSSGCLEFHAKKWRNKTIENI